MSADLDSCRAEIKARRCAGNGLEFEPAAFAAAMGLSWPNSELQASLDQLVEDEEVRRIDVQRCPNGQCHQLLDTGMIENGECPACGFSFKEEGEVPITSVRYRIQGEPSRDIRWMIVVHGMNTRAPWQEDFSWLVANKLKYAAPVLIHKYGWATIDVLVVRRHRQLARTLGARIRRAVEYARARGLTDAPDVLVHSFGSRLFSLIMNDEAFSDLNFGRVITAGSIIPPDFNWRSLIDEGRVEAVLNHMGGRDLPVLLAQFLIPGTGPGGRVGYLDDAAFNHLSPTFGHSDCLAEKNLVKALAKDGLWDQFLTRPNGRFTPSEPFRPTKWRPALLPIRWLTRLAGLLLFVALSPFSWLRRRLDP